MNENSYPYYFCLPLSQIMMACLQLTKITEKKRKVVKKCFLKIFHTFRLGKVLKRKRPKWIPIIFFMCAIFVLLSFVLYNE